MTTTDHHQLDPTGGTGGYTYLLIEVACDGHRITIHPNDSGWTWTAYNGATQRATGTANRFVTAAQTAAHHLDEPYLAALLSLDQTLDELYHGRLCDWCGYQPATCLCECRICGASDRHECLCRQDRP